MEGGFAGYKVLPPGAGRFLRSSAYLKLARENELNIISRFKSNLPYRGAYKGQGRPKTKGDKVNLEQLPAGSLEDTIEDEKQQVRTRIYSFKAYTPAMAGVLLQVVVLVHNGAQRAHYFVQQRPGA